MIIFFLSLPKWSKNLIIQEPIQEHKAMTQR